MKQVIPFDFEHASELAATQGSIPGSGAPAPAWALELEVRDGARGEAQLWAYAKLGERIRSYMADDEYRHVSIAFSLDAIDPTSGRAVGPRLSSIAFTNHPFLRGLTPIAAKKTKAQIAAKHSAPNVLFIAKSVDLSDATDLLGERPPIDLSGAPVNLEADDAVEQVIAYLGEGGDGDFNDMTEDEQRTYAEACIEFTRDTLSDSQDPNERANRMNGINANPLKLTRGEIEISINAGGHARAGGRARNMMIRRLDGPRLRVSCAGPR